MTSFFTDDVDPDVDELIELKTLPYPSGRRKDQQTMSSAPQKRKGGLKERIFGTRRVSGVGNKGIINE